MNVECLCKGFHTPFNGQCPLNTTPENVEEPSLMQVVFNAVEKAKADREEPCPTCGGDGIDGSDDAARFYAYGGKITTCPDCTPENVETQ